MPARPSPLVRFVATWLLGGVILSVVFGPAIGIPVALGIALGYVDAIHWKLVIRRLTSNWRPRADSEQTTPR
jgi:hypothetical protein